MDLKEKKLSGKLMGIGYYLTVFISIAISGLGIYIKKDFNKKNLDS